LLVALIFLVIMAMLGVTVANVTTLQERMAGHTRDRDLALQSAETALREAEGRLSDPAFRALAVTFVATNANDDEFWESCFKNKPSPCTAPLEPTGSNIMPLTGEGAVAEQPLYVLERKPDIGPTQVYRVTARAVGGTVDAVVVLQAEYGFTP
jgi:type IV pilus assembly protein PilX